MYYPLLRARQFELITVRELAIEKISQGYILPILEPVRKSFSNLNLAYQILEKEQQQVYLIINPSVGESIGDDNHFIDYIIGKDNSILRPAFYYQNNVDYIHQSIENYNLTNCMLLCQNDVNINDASFKALLQLAQINIINVEDPGRNRELNRYIKGLNKTYIRLFDLFEKQSCNSDFLPIEAHRFSEEHLFFEEEGYSGFSDYTILPNEYSDGGRTPRAVVIHLTYLNDQNQIWIRHFTSDTNDSISNVQGKFGEAAKKAVTFCRKNDLSNHAIRELEEYFNEEHYPGLGVIKKISIKNHLEVVREFLANR